MSDLTISNPNLFRDPLSTLFYGWAKTELGLSEEEAIKVGAIRGRDKCRTPMQWKNEVNGGFSPAGITPWLPVNPDYASGVNVADQSHNPDSLLTFYQKVLSIRKNSPALSLGDFQILNRKPKDILYYKREYDTEVVSILLNMSSRTSIG